VLADVMSWVPPGFGPFDSYQAEHTVTGGDRLALAGLDIDVLFTPGHSPGHVTYAIARAGGAAVAGGAGDDAPGAAAERALLSGDVLFAGSVGRVDLPGGDWATLERSIGSLLRSFPGETVVYPGHMGVTTLARERDTNPFLADLVRGGQRERVPRETVTPDATAAGS
jgi:glyoxylase-like metal-dependent hydrolase (beta-lactamase superfamily II)